MESKGVLSYDEETCRLCMTPQSGVININSSISSKFGKIIDMVRYCYDIEMVNHDALPSLICNECALHLTVAHNLKGKFLMTEKSFLDYLTGEIESKKHIEQQLIPEELSITDVPLNDSQNEGETYDRKVQLLHNSSLSNTVERTNTGDNNECNKKYVRPNLMAYFQHNTLIELSDTDSDTDNEDTAMNGTDDKSTKNTYECPICPEFFMDLFTFNNHVRDHDGKVCKVCSKICSTGSNLILHFRTHRPDQKIKCPNCDYACSSKVSVCSHIRKFHNKGSTNYNTNEQQKVMKCNRCDLYFSCIEEFRIHLHGDHKIIVENNNEAGQQMTFVSDSEALKCNICTRQLKNSISYSLHMKLHQQDKLSFCYVCKLSFRNNMSVHFKMRHTGLLPYKCTDHCEETFKTKKQFKDHQRLVKKRRIESDSSSNQQKATPKELNLHFANKFSRYSLPSESNRYNSDVPIPPFGYVYRPIQQTKKTFDCYICDFMYETEDKFNEHVESHQVKKCKICFRLFGNFRALAGHFKINHSVEEGKDQYECKDCGRAFDRFFSLKQHQNKHVKKRQTNS